jgi:hypothetical protein
MISMAISKVELRVKNWELRAMVTQTHKLGLTQQPYSPAAAWYFFMYVIFTPGRRKNNIHTVKNAWLA